MRKESKYVKTLARLQVTEFFFFFFYARYVEKLFT